MKMLQVSNLKLLKNLEVLYFNFLVFSQLLYKKASYPLLFIFEKFVLLPTV